MGEGAYTVTGRVDEPTRFTSEENWEEYYFITWSFKQSHYNGNGKE